MTQILERTYDVLFGCWHTNYTFPITRGKGREAKTTVCCLDCGKEFPYDFEQMRRTN